MPIRWIKRLPKNSRRSAAPPTAVQKADPVVASAPRVNRSRLHAAPLWSILVPTIPGRERKLGTLCAILDPQLQTRTDIELIVVRDSRGMTIGEKRNRMLMMARGKFVSFIDDDDEVVSDYVEEISKKLIAEDPDCLCFRLMVEGYGPKRPCRYHPSLGDVNLPTEYLRKPNHLMVWRRELALREPFPSIQTGEDTIWAGRMCKHAVKVATIDRVLYSYKYDPQDNSGINAASNSVESK